MESFYEKILEVVANYGVFAIMFSVAIILLYRKYEGDIERYRHKEEQVNALLLKNHEVIVNSQVELSRVLERIDKSQEGISTCLTNMNTELKVFIEVQKHKNGKELKRGVKRI